MRRRLGARAVARLAFVAIAAPVLFLVVLGWALPAAASSTGSATTASPTSTTPSTTLPGVAPLPIQVGPTAPTPTTLPAGSGTAVSTAGTPSPGLFDITGHIEAAIDGWFQAVVTDALNPVLTLMGHTLLATPNVTAEDVRSQHYAFLVDDAEFDPIFERVRTEAIVYYADPMHEHEGEINTRHSGRGFYFNGPEGHNLEVITRPYGTV